MSEYVIIGNGVASVGCIEGIRSTDKESGITVVSAENHFVYGRPLISYLLEGKTDIDHINYRPEDFYDQNNCKVLYGKKAVSIDKNSGKVVLDDGSALPFSSVCVAAGSCPFVPPFKGLEKVTNKFSFMTLDDANALGAAVTKESKVLIIGSGLIGLKCAEGIFEKVASITVCDLADRILPSIFDAECAGIMQKHLEKKGIKFILGNSASEFKENSAIMQDGSEIEFDVLVLAVGVRANVGLVKDLGGEVNRGIIVDEKMKTSIDDVYAAGDCTEGFDVSFGRKRVLALLPNAYMQGYTAGVNMAGGEKEQKDAIPMNSLVLFGLHAMTAGTYEGELYEEKGEDFIKRIFIKDNVLKGFIIIGKNERAGIYTSLIKNKVPLDTLDFEALRQGASTLIFSKEERKKIFGGLQ